MQTSGEENSRQREQECLGPGAGCLMGLRNDLELSEARMHEMRSEALGSQITQELVGHYRTFFFF